MPSERPSGRTWADPVLRAFLVLLALALAVLAIVRLRELEEEQREAALWLEQTGVTQEVALDREPDRQRVRLRAARAAFASELNPARRAGLAPETAARESAARLAEIARVAGEVLAARPASWDAALLHGASTYLSWAQTRDPRLFTRYRAWEAPLERARELAPGQREPVRFLAMAYLDVWPALSPRKRGIAKELLGEVLRQPEDLGRLLDPWLATAADRREAFSVLPDEPEVWERVESSFVGRGDWEGFRAARSRRDAALLAGLRRDLAEADRLRRAGNVSAARSLYLSVAARARPDARSLSVLEPALTRCPPGPVARETGAKLAPHLAWVLDRCQRARCPIEPDALKRLVRFVRDTTPAEEALAYVFAGDLPEAERLERRAGTQWDESWAPYLVAKAAALAERGRVDEAELALSEVNRSWQQHPLFWQARLQVARAAADPAALKAAEAGLAAFGRSAWPATAWTWRGNLARLEIVAAAPARGLIVDLDEVPAPGAVVELRLDGALLGAFPVRPGPAGGTAALPVAVPLGRGLHLLELESTIGGRVLPGGVLLR